MRLAGALTAALGMVAVIASPSLGQSSVAQAEAHLRQACELVWANAKPRKVERCTRRAMAALGNDDQLRDNELKRLLVNSDRELRTCKEELARATDETSPVKTAAKTKSEPEP